MAIKDEATGLGEKLLHAKANPFEWGDCQPRVQKELRDQIMRNPYPCDECGDIYNMKDLYHFQEKEKYICRNCL